MDKDLLQTLVRDRLSLSEISRKTGFSRTNIRYWLKKYELKTAPIGRGVSNASYRCSCGETNPKKFYGHKKSICGKCHNKYTLRMGNEKRKRALDLLGGKCLKCSYNKYEGSLDFHHLEPTKKDPNFAGLRSWSWDKIVKEIKNCIILCANCHREEHSKRNVG